MFEGTILLFSWFGLLLLSMAANPSLVVPIIFLLVVTFPLVAILVCRIQTQQDGRRNLDPACGRRSCPACGETFPTPQVICPNCYKELVKNCPACGEIVDRERDKCPTCGERLPIDLPTRPHPTKMSNQGPSQIRV